VNIRTAISSIKQETKLLPTNCSEPPEARAFDGTNADACAECLSDCQLMSYFLDRGYWDSASISSNKFV